MFIITNNEIVHGQHLTQTTLNEMIKEFNHILSLSKMYENIKNVRERINPTRTFVPVFQGYKLYIIL